MTHSDIEPSGFLRFGHVSAYDSKRHMARIIFPGMDDVVSAWLPVTISCSNGNFSESHIDVGTHVACIMAGEGTESGVIIGCIYDDSNTPKTGNENITCLEFSDGTRLSYDRENHSLDISAKGQITISTSGAVTVNAESITANAQGNITANASGSVKLIADGGATVIGASNGLVNVSSQSVAIESSQNISLSSSSSSSMQSSGEIKITSAEKITLHAHKVNIEED